ncbi:cytochrome b [soil metagenome]
MTDRIDTGPYDGRTIALHWLTLLLVLGQWLGAQTIDWFPRGALRTDVRSLHIVFGSILAAVIVARLAWRMSGGRRLPSADTGVMKVLSSSVHKLLYALVIATVLLGIFNAWLRGDNLFGLFAIPKFPTTDVNLRESVGELHGLAANGILIVAALHTAAALWHQYIRRDGLLGRMIPALARRPS